MAKKTTKPKNIILCCDGTGNKPSHGEASNVYDLVELLNGTDNQLVYYDTGLGTEAAPGKQTGISKSLNMLAGLAFAVGFQKNVTDAYLFLMENYTPGDKVYIFGFSRGAYTARALIGMIQQMGLLKRGSKNMVPYAVSTYTKKTAIEWKDIKSFQGRLCQIIDAGGTKYELPIEYVGIFDTVKSVGLLRHSTRLAYTRRLPTVKSIRHAVALDEKRSKYRPNHISANGKRDGCAQTMWFQGAHSDIGGGYPEQERGLSDHAMKWILAGAKEHGMEFDANKLDKMIATRKKNVPEHHYYQMHKSLTWHWWILGWLKRKLPHRFWLHETAIKHFLDSKIRCDFDPQSAIRALGTDEVCFHGDVIVLRHHGSLLVQKLTDNELKYFETVPTTAQDALIKLLSAGISCWETEFNSAFSAGKFDLTSNMEKKAKELLAGAREEVTAGNIKGPDGAYDKIASFLRMRAIDDTYLESYEKYYVMQTAPHLMEALAEFKQ